MNDLPAPASVTELAEAVRAYPHVLAVGAQTKPRLSVVKDGVTPISTRNLTGLIEYEPDEYTFTAFAGTPLRELAAALAAKAQYLPFDPPLAASGATLGGTVAAGLSGPGRFRYGGLRDFILGVRFVDGSGRVMRMGGKVVKNAAGFDLPKFFVGSLGRLGILAELTFKVFPRAISSMTLRLPVTAPAQAMEIFDAVGRSRWEAEAIDLAPGGDAVLLRLAGPPGPLQAVSAEILARYQGEQLEPETAGRTWSDLAEFRWVDRDRSLLKIALAPAQVPAMLAATHALGGQAHVSSGGNVAFVALPSGCEAAALGMPALTLRGKGSLWLLAPLATAVGRAMKVALDPVDRFPSFD